jgi:hypothetical protein
MMATIEDIQGLYNRGIIFVERAKKLRKLADDPNYDIVKQTRFMQLASLQMQRAKECLIKANDLIDENLSHNN